MHFNTLAKAFTPLLACTILGVTVASPQDGGDAGTKVEKARCSAISRLCVSDPDRNCLDTDGDGYCDDNEDRVKPVPVD